MPTLCQQIAAAFQAHLNCERDLNSEGIHESLIPLRQEWSERLLNRIERMCREYLPSGGGFDSGTQFIKEFSRPDRLVFAVEFHHMNDSGFYDGWTYHKVIVTPSFFGFDLKVTGLNRNEIKEYIADVFHSALSAPVETPND